MSTKIFIPISKHYPQNLNKLEIFQFKELFYDDHTYKIHEKVPCYFSLMALIPNDYSATRMGEENLNRTFKKLSDLHFYSICNFGYSPELDRVLTFLIEENVPFAPITKPRDHQFKEFFTELKNILFSSNSKYLPLELINIVALYVKSRLVKVVDQILKVPSHGYFYAEKIPLTPRFNVMWQSLISSANGRPPTKITGKIVHINMDIGYEVVHKYKIKQFLHKYSFHQLMLKTSEKKRLDLQDAVSMSQMLILKSDDLKLPNKILIDQGYYCTVIDAMTCQRLDLPKESVRLIHENHLYAFAKSNPLLPDHETLSVCLDYDLNQTLLPRLPHSDANMMRAFSLGKHGILLLIDNSMNEDYDYYSWEVVAYLYDVDHRTYKHFTLECPGFYDWSYIVYYPETDNIHFIFQSDELLHHYTVTATKLVLASGKKSVWTWLASYHVSPIVEFDCAN